MSNIAERTEELLAVLEKCNAMFEKQLKQLKEVSVNTIKYIIVYGNLSDGFHFRGPFDTFALASDYIDASEHDEIAWIAELVPPYEQPVSEEPKGSGTISENRA